MAPTAKNSKTKKSTPAKKAVEKIAQPIAADKKADCSKSEVCSQANFEIEAPQARSVLLAGSFNGWKPEAAPLKREKNGKWTASVPLAPGRYEYRYVVDGRWVSDSSRPAVANPFGSSNNVIEIR